ncbi:MAG: DUF1428 domain-containing protein [Nitrosomonas sp.]|nr:DUF1428 domain-containing protein [Nitrosomonas sp.]MCW5607693.1 DUF1428 domain-containing protein [Nitrosomonas sp.]
MNRYIDGFIIPVPTARIDDYRNMAEKAAQIWKEHGALDYWECIGDDMDVQDTLSFPQLANIKPGETVIFAWVVFESREARDSANVKIFEDPRVKEMMDSSDQIFDCKRMAYGGFKPLVHA